MLLNTDSLISRMDAGIGGGARKERAIYETIVLKAF